MEIDLSQAKVTRSTPQDKKPAVLVMKLISGEQVMCCRGSDNKFTKFIGINVTPDGRVALYQWWLHSTLELDWVWVSKHAMIIVEAQGSLLDAYTRATSSIAIASSMPQRPPT